MHHVFLKKDFSFGHSCLSSHIAPLKALTPRSAQLKNQTSFKMSDFDPFLSHGLKDGGARK